MMMSSLQFTMKVDFCVCKKIVNCNLFPMKCLGVLRNSFTHVHAFQIELECRRVVF